MCRAGNAFQTIMLQDVSLRGKADVRGPEAKVPRVPVTDVFLLMGQGVADLVPGWASRRAGFAS
jgi:hypothetical protein